MDITLENAVGRLRQFGFVFPPADEEAIRNARHLGMPPEAIDFYQQCDGGFIIEGRDFTGPDSRIYRFRIPRISELQTVQSCGYISEDSALYQASANWWQILDCCDGNWLALDATQEGAGRVIEIFHETVGGPESHMVVEESLAHLLWQLAEFKDSYWLAENFEPIGFV